MLTKKSKDVDWVNIPLEECMHGNGMDSHYTSKIYHRLLEDLQEKKLVHLYENLISPLTTIFAEMEFNGIIIDQDELAKLKKEISEKLAKTEADLRSLPFVPPDINLNSNADQVKVLFSLVRDKKTKEWNIDESVGFGKIGRAHV